MLSSSTSLTKFDGAVYFISALDPQLEIEINSIPIVFLFYSFFGKQTLNSTREKVCHKSV